MTHNKILKSIRNELTKAEFIHNGSKHADRLGRAFYDREQILVYLSEDFFLFWWWKMHENVNNFLLLDVVAIFVIFNKTSFPAMFLCRKIFSTQPTHRRPEEGKQWVRQRQNLWHNSPSIAKYCLHGKILRNLIFDSWSLHFLFVNI